DAHDLTPVAGEVLCILHLEALAEGDEQLAVRRDYDPGTEMNIRPIGGLLTENDLNVLQPWSVVPFDAARAGDRRAIAAAFERLGVGKIDRARRLEIGRERDIEQTALPLREHLGHALERSCNLAF